MNHDGHDLMCFVCFHGAGHENMLYHVCSQGTPHGQAAGRHDERILALHTIQRLFENKCIVLRNSSILCCSLLSVDLDFTPLYLEGI